MFLLTCPVPVTVVPVTQGFDSPMLTALLVGIASWEKRLLQRAARNRQKVLGSCDLPDYETGRVGTLTIHLADGDRVVNSGGKTISAFVATRSELISVPSRTQCLAMSPFHLP